MYRRIINLNFLTIESQMPAPILNLLFFVIVIRDQFQSCTINNAGSTQGIILFTWSACLVIHFYHEYF